MKSKLFWQKLKIELKKGKTFDTLYRYKQFDAYQYYNEILIIPQTTRQIRDVREKDFRVIWKYGLTLNEKQKLHPKFYNEMVQGRIVTASYVLKLIDFYLKKFKTKWE